MPSPRDSGALLTVGEAAHELRVSSLTVRRRIADGTLPAIRVGAGKLPRVRIARADLVDYVTRCSTAGDAGA